MKPGFNCRGVTYEIDWTTVNVGDSFFLPCVDTSTAITRMRDKIKKLNWEMTYEVRIEAGKWGVRFWRTV
jgi:hypothetical protein